MRLCDLPDDLLALVLEAAFHDDGRDYAFKANLPLVAVCQRWRRLALPMVYDTVHIRCDDVICDPDPRAAPGSPERCSSSTKPMATSNVGLAASAGCVGLVKNVCIVLTCMHEHLEGFTKAVGLMCAAASKWHGAQSLSITGYMYSGYVNANGINVADYEKELWHLSHALTGLMPGMRRLWCDRHIGVVLVKTLCARLAGRVAHQLDEFQCHFSELLPPDCRFTQPRDVRINCNNDSGNQLPRIDPARLEKLEISNALPTHSWSAFGSGGDSRAITFPALRSLHLDYNRVSSSDNRLPAARLDGRPWKLRFPQLRSVNVITLADTCPMLECAVLPSRVRKLRIYGKAALYQSLAKVELPATKCLELHISSNTEGYPNVIASLNRIFTSAQWSDNELLHDSVGSRVALPRCGVSRGLTVATAIDADTIIELIQMLPRLTELRLSYCVLSAIRTDISIPEPGAHQPIEPFDTRIQRLECCLSRENRPPELEIQLVRFLLLKIPTLTKLVATTVSRQAIDSFINEYVQWYPHLSRVDLEFY